MSRVFLPTLQIKLLPSNFFSALCIGREVALHFYSTVAFWTCQSQIFPTFPQLHQRPPCVTILLYCSCLQNTFLQIGGKFQMLNTGRTSLWKKKIEKRKGLSRKFLFTRDTCFYYFYFSYKLKFLEQGRSIFLINLLFLFEIQSIILFSTKPNTSALNMSSNLQLDNNVGNVVSFQVAVISVVTLALSPVMVFKLTPFQKKKIQIILMAQ